MDRVSAFGENYHEQAALLRCPERQEAIFVYRVGNVRLNLGQRIAEDGSGFLECDAVPFDRVVVIVKSTT